VPKADEKWLGRLFHEPERKFLRFLASRLRDGTEVDDLVQEAYLRLLRVEDVRAIDNPRSFATRVATNVAYEWGRLSRNRRSHLDEEALGEEPESSPTPFERAAHAEELKILNQALARLTPLRRAALLLHKRDGLTYEQIATHLGISVGMVAKHLARGLLTCQEFVRESRRQGGKEP
jgi:RNA polymerase sigma factor (sigma-70 family)